MNGYSFTAENAYGDKVDLYNDPEAFLTYIDGIDFEAEVKTSSLGGKNGSCVTGFRLPEREISITVRYNSKSGSSELAKLRVHSVFATARPITLRYISPNGNKVITGYCTRVNTPPHTFPMVTSIDILCPDPVWRDGNEAE